MINSMDRLIAKIWQLRIFLLFMCIYKLNSQTVPSLKAYPLLNEKDSHIEPEFIQLIDSKSTGYSRIYWSGGFNMYHSAVIRRDNYQLHAFCQCTPTKVRQVNFYFKRFIGLPTDEQKLEVFINTPSPARWPSYNQDYAETRIEFDSEKGANFVLIFSKTTPDMRNMGGTLRCELITQNDISLRSASLDIYDVREAVSMLSPPAQVMPDKDTYLYTSGVAEFKPVPSQSNQNNMLYVQQLIKYVTLDLKWSIAEEDISFSNAIQYNSKLQIFKKVREMDNTDLGQYYIKEDGTLFVNMASNKGQQLRSTLDRTGIYNNKLRDILMLSDDTSTVGYKFYVRPPGDIRTWPQNSPNSTPVIIEPSKPNSPKNTFVNNRDHRITCGFLVNSNTAMQIEWYKDGTLQSDLLREYPLHGVRIGDRGGLGVILDMRSIKLSASGIWECRLRGTQLRGSYQVTVMQYPSFGDNNVGQPPKLIFAMENSDIKIRCAIRSMDLNKKSAAPQFQVENVPFETLCQNNQLPRNAALCDLRNSVTISAETPQPQEDPFVKTSTYKITKIPYTNAATKQQMNHVVNCLATGTYINQNEQQTDISAISSTSINVVQRLTNETFSDIDLSGCSDVNPCRITQPRTFKCTLNPAYIAQLNNQDLVVQKYWKIGSLSQATIASLADDSVIKKYTNFTDDGNMLTIKEINSEDDIKVFNDIGKISCVIEIYYPSYITADQLKNFEVVGDGMTITNSNTTIFAAKSDPLNTFGPLIYSTELDSLYSKVLSSTIVLEGKPIPPEISQAGMLIVIPIVVVVILVIAILIFTIYKCRTWGRETAYMMGEKEENQGRNPEQELKNLAGFKPYDGDASQYEKSAIIGRKRSIHSEIAVGSDDDGELDEYGEPDTGKFNEDGSFIGDYQYARTNSAGVNV